MTEASELSRPIRVRHLPAGQVTIQANDIERAALAARFGVTAIHALIARMSLEQEGEAIRAAGTLTAEIEQPCAVSGEQLSYTAEEDITLRFVPAGASRAYNPDEEIELTAEDLDEIEYEGENIDLGEAAAQTLGLAIDPYRVGSAAEVARKEGLVSSEQASGPFAALAALRKD